MVSNHSFRIGPAITALMLSAIRAAHHSRRDGFARSYDRVVGTRTPNDQGSFANAPRPINMAFVAGSARIEQAPRPRTRSSLASLLLSWLLSCAGICDAQIPPALTPSNRWLSPIMVEV